MVTAALIIIAGAIVCAAIGLLHTVCSVDAKKHAELIQRDAEHVETINKLGAEIRKLQRELKSVNESKKT